MSRKLIAAQLPFKMLVPCLTGGSDPSRGPSGNPIKKRQTMQVQSFVEIPGRGPEISSVSGVRSYSGLLTDLPASMASPPSPSPHGAEATIRLAGSTFEDREISLHLGQYVLTGDVEFGLSSEIYTDEDITSTPPDGIIVVWKTAGAGVGEGTIVAPNHLPIDSGGVTISWTSGAAVKTQVDNGGGSFSGDGGASMSVINYDTGELLLDTTGDAPDIGSTITISYSNVLNSLSSAIDDLPGYTSSMLSGLLTISGPSGPLGNEILFEMRGSSNFALLPSSGKLDSALPRIGPPDIE